MSIFGIQVMRFNDFERAFDAADNGVELAQRFVFALAKWNSSQDGHIAYCYACKATIKPKNFGGLANAYEESSGILIAGAFCEQCESIGPQALADLFVKCINTESRVECVSVH